MASVLLPIAHAGHWLVNAAYFAPVVAFLGWLGYSTLRDRRAERREPAAEDGNGPVAGASQSPRDETG